MPVIPEIGRLRQEDCEIVSLRLAWLYSETLSQKQTEKQNNPTLSAEMSLCSENSSVQLLIHK
jgi:hypothetical protein